MHRDTYSKAFSYKKHIGGQYAQPSFPSKVGLPTYAASAHTSASIHESMVLGTRKYIFGSLSGTGTLLSAVERYCLLAQRLVEAFLLCAWFLTDVAADGTPQLSDPVLVVANAPMVPPRGEITSAEELWPDVSALGPSQWNPHEDPISVVGMSVVNDSQNPVRSIAKLTKSRDDYLAGMVFAMEGLGLTKVGWTLMNAPASLMSAVFYHDRFPAQEGFSPSDYLGPGVAPTVVPAGQQTVMLPKAFPLSFGHGIPTGLVIAADIGSK